MLIAAIISTIIIKILSNTSSVLYPKAKVTGDGKIKIACLGDSITYGFNDSNYIISDYNSNIDNKREDFNYGSLFKFCN